MELLVRRGYTRDSGELTFSLNPLCFIKKTTRRNKMKKLFLGIIFSVLVVSVPVPAIAGMNINIGISPPSIMFSGPPEVVVLPDTEDVYVVPGLDIDLFFWNGWWWRYWEGRWYRSHRYNRMWALYPDVPAFYFDVDPHWREYYRNHDWQGHRWNYELIPDRRLRQSWKKWRDERHWERQKSWGVQKYQPRPQMQRQELRHQRQQQYQQRPEVQRPLQQMREHQRPPQTHKPEMRQPRQPQQQMQPQVKQPHVGQPEMRQPQRQPRQPHQATPQIKQHQRQQPKQEQYQQKGKEGQGKSDHEGSRERHQRGDQGERR
jgi:hypothetical protein